MKRRPRDARSGIFTRPLIVLLLTGGVWSADPAHALAVARRVRTGTVTVNGAPIARLSRPKERRRRLSGAVALAG